jgi:hypothetical protein
MARLIGVGVFLWSLWASMSYAWGVAPQPAEPDGVTSTATEIGHPLYGEASYGETAVADTPPTTLVFDPTPQSIPADRVWTFGAYAIGDDPDPDVAARDRDITPREPLFEEDERLDSVTVPSYMHAVQGELEPGLYLANDISGECNYRLWRVMKKTRTAQIIGEENLSQGRLLVTIDGYEPDWFTASAGCGHWQQWAPRPDPTAPVGNGDYAAGDLAPGRWQVPEGCIWEQVVAFRGAALRDVAANGRGPAVVEVDRSGLGLRLRSCHSPATYDQSSQATNRR